MRRSPRNAGDSPGRTRSQRQAAKRAFFKQYFVEDDFSDVR